MFDAFRRTVQIGPGGTMVVPRTAFRNALLDIQGYQGLSGILECRPTGGRAQAALIAVYQAPGWPVDGGVVAAPPVFSQYKTLAEVQGAG